MLAPFPIRLDTIIPHAHLWSLYVITDGRDDEIRAMCEGCPAELTKEQAEAILNGHQLEVQVA